MSSKLTRCRVCGAAQIGEAGQVEYYRGYAWSVYDCRSCGCRFTRHDDSVYNVLHSSGAISYYSEYRTQAERSKEFFARRDVAGLRAFLAGSSKYRFVMDALDERSPEAKLLEVGCSRGYLTSWFILNGRKVLGIDVSEDAITSARRSFGEFFELPSSPAIQSGAPYDVVYHVGMIGCVADPVGLTTQLLALLKPGGLLLFNAPNRQACSLRSQLWIDSAPPPDVVTLFPPGFWTAQFPKVRVEEEVELWPADKSVEILLGRILARRWRKPEPLPLANMDTTPSTRTQPSSWVWRNLERAAKKIAKWTRLDQRVPRQPSEFGLFVKMTTNFQT